MYRLKAEPRREDAEPPFEPAFAVIVVADGLLVEAAKMQPVGNAIDAVNDANLGGKNVIDTTSAGHGDPPEQVRRRQCTVVLIDCKGYVETRDGWPGVPVFPVLFVEKEKGKTMNNRTWRECVRALGGLLPLPESEFVSLTEDEIEAIEARCGTKLPFDYREFLTTYGSSTFSRSVSIRSVGPLPATLTEDGLLPFDEFYGAMRLADRCPSVLLCIDYFHGEIPDGLLSIANGWEDDQICMGLTGELRGKVFYWDSQGVGESVGGNVASSRSIAIASDFDDTYFIANSFTDLLDRMEHSTSDDDEY